MSWPKAGKIHCTDYHLHDNYITDYIILSSSSSSSQVREACHDQKLGRSSWWIAVDKHTKATVRAPSMRFISPFKTHFHHHSLNPPFVIIAFWWFLSGFQFGLGESQIFLHVVCYPTKGRKYEWEHLVVNLICFFPETWRVCARGRAGEKKWLEWTGGKSQLIIFASFWEIWGRLEEPMGLVEEYSWQQV